MSRERFFIERAPDGLIVRLPREEAHHLRRVRRVPVGAEVVLFDGSGTDYVGRVKEFDRTGAVVEITGTEQTTREPDVAVTLAVAVVKQQAMDQLVDTCTQLGVMRFIPMVTERTVVRPRGNKAGRWRRIAIEACKQCGRSVIPEIAEGQAFADVIRCAKEYELSVVAAMRPDARPLAAVVRPCRAALCIVGPEGGFTVDEEGRAIEAGCVPVSLGKCILRTETAAAAAAAIVTMTVQAGLEEQE